MLCASLIFFINIIKTLQRLLIHLQFHQLALPLNVILKVHQSKGQKLIHNHKNMKLHHNKGKDNNLNLHKQRQGKKAAWPPSDVWEHFIKKENSRAYCK